jgi:hypothetical protein
VWYSIDALVAGYAADFAHIVVLEISAIENLGLQVKQSGDNMHADINFPEADLGDKNKMSIHAEQLARIASVVNPSEWIPLLRTRSNI